MRHRRIHLGPYVNISQLDVGTSQNVPGVAAHRNPLMGGCRPPDPQRSSRRPTKIKITYSVKSITKSAPRTRTRKSSIFGTQMALPAPKAIGRGVGRSPQTFSGGLCGGEGPLGPPKSMNSGSGGGAFQSISQITSSRPAAASHSHRRALCIKYV